MSTTKRQIEKRLAEIGYGPLTDDDLYKVDSYGYWEYSLYSPPGLMFDSTGCHALCGSADTKAEAYNEIMQDVGGKGLVPCTVEDCDPCREER